MKKLIVSIIALAVITTGFFMLKQESEAESFGTITVELVDDKNQLTTKEISFDEGETLLDLLQSNYQVGCADDTYKISDVCEKTTFGGHVILQIENVVTDWNNSYVAIYINNVYSTSGIDQVELVDGNVYRFEHTVYGGEWDDN